MSRQWRSRRSRWERQKGLGVCPSGGTGSTAPRSWSVNAFCVMVKTYSWIPKCKTKCIMYNLRVLNYACEIIQACKDISVGCRWYQSRFRGVNMSSEPSKELFNTIGERHERNERQFFRWICYQGSCAKHLTIEFYTVVMLLTFILNIISIPSPLTLSFQA